MLRWRSWLASVSFAVTLGLLAVLFIMMNYLSSRHYARWDLTQQQLTRLSDQTLQTLKSLKEPVSIIVFYQPGARLYELVTDLLNEYARVSPLLKIERVDPEQDVARAKQLAQQLQIEDLNVVVFQAGARHRYLSDAELAEYDTTSMTQGGQPRVKTFKGEEACTSAILSVTRAQSPLVWFTSGHGEKSVESPEVGGLSDVKKFMEQQNISVKTVTLLERSVIPPDVKLVIIAGATHRLTDSEIALLQTYLEQGGRLLALIDPLTDTALEGLLARWGVALGNDIVVDPARQLPFVSAANLFVTTYTQHPIVEKMKTLMTLYPLARSVRPANPVPAGLTVTPLALTSESGWGETQTSVATFQFNPGEDLKGPVSIAVASERVMAATESGNPPQAGRRGSPDAAGGGATEPGAPRRLASPSEAKGGGGEVPGRNGAPATRLVVFGDSDFIVNAQVGNVGNKDMLLGATYWLIEQEQLIGIGPKPIESIKLNLTGGQLTGAFWLSFAGFPLLFGMLGIGMWWLRRK